MCPAWKMSGMCSIMRWSLFSGDSMVFPPYRGARCLLCRSSLMAFSGWCGSICGTLAMMSSRLRPWYMRISTPWIPMVHGSPRECILLVPWSSWRNSLSIAGCGSAFLGESWFPGEMMTSMCSGMRSMILDANLYCLWMSLMASSFIWFG